MATTDLMTALPIASVTFMQQWRQEFARQAGGLPRVADIGPAIWMAKIQTGEMYNDDAESAAALINQMGGSLGTFLAWNPRRPYPKADPTGALIAGHSPTLNDVSGNVITLHDLPAGYQISRGDKISWDWGSSPTHRAFHEFCADATADGSGVLTCEVSPYVRTGWAVNAAVTLAQPTVEMMISPGTFDFPSSGALHSTLSFTAIQVP